MLGEAQERSRVGEQDRGVDNECAQARRPVGEAVVRELALRVLLRRAVTGVLRDPGLR